MVTERLNLDMLENQIFAELVRAGAFGTLYFGEGEYLRELRAAPQENPMPWRRRWRQGIPGITYGSHSLGPLLTGMGRRMSRGRPAPVAVIITMTRRVGSMKLVIRR